MRKTLRFHYNFDSKVFHLYNFSKFFFSSPNNWTAETTLDVGPFIALLSKAELDVLAEKVCFYYNFKICKRYC